MEQTVDLIETLKRIEQEAAKAKRRIAEGRALNGVGALEKIRNEASDVLVRAGEPRRSPKALAEGAR